MKNEASDILSYLIFSRGTGRTTVLAKAAKKLNGIFVCGTRHHVEQVRRDYNVDTVCINSLESVLGTNKPVIFDHFVVEKLIRKWAMTIDKLHKAEQVLRSNADIWREYERLCQVSTREGAANSSEEAAAD